MSGALKPPFTEDTARAKIQAAQDGCMQTRTASINDVPITTETRILPFIEGMTA